MSFGALLGQRPSSGGMTAEILVKKNEYTTEMVVTDFNGENVEVNVVDNFFVAKINQYGEYKADVTLDSNIIKTIINVDSCKQFFVPLFDSTLNNNTWSQIQLASKTNIASSVWSVGDAKEITLNGKLNGVTYNNLKTWVYILGFNHNSELEGNNAIHFGCFRNGQEYSETNSIALDDSYYDKRDSTNSSSFFISHTINNTGGWKETPMRKFTLGAIAASPMEARNDSLLYALPNDLKSVIKQCTKYTNNGTSSAPNKITSTQDWMFLLSEFEVFGENEMCKYSEANYQKQYDYYKLGNAKVKYKQSNMETLKWWLRSPIEAPKNYVGWCVVKVTGTVDYNYPDYSYGCAPAFCV